MRGRGREHGRTVLVPGKICTPMTLLLRDIKHAEGVNDVQTIKCGGERCFAAAFGRFVRVHDAAGRRLHTLHVDGYVKSIVPHGSRYALLCEDCYFICVDDTVSERMALDVRFTNIYKVLVVADYFVVFHDHSYSVGRFARNRLVFDRGLSDAAFYRISSATRGCVLAAGDINFYDHRAAGGGAKGDPATAGEGPGGGDAVLILAKTLRSRYLIQYSVRNGALANTRRAVPNGDFIFSHGGRVLAVDEQGLWELTSKMVFLKEFGNNRISCVYDDCGRALAFCLNREVVEIVLGDAGVATRTVATLPTVVSRVERIGDVYFCGSRDGWYLLSGRLEILEMASSYGDVRGLRLVDGGLEYDNMGRFSLHPGDRVPLHRRHGRFRIEKTILSRGVADGRGGGDGSARLESSRPLKHGACRLELAFMTARVRILSYSTFSVLNGLPFERVSSCHEFGDTTVFTTDNAVFVLADTLTLIPIRSTVVRYHRGLVYTYFYDKLSIIDVGDVASRAAVAAPVGLYDIAFDPAGRALMVLLDGSVAEIGLDGDAGAKRLKTSFIEYPSLAEYARQQGAALPGDAPAGVADCMRFLDGLDQRLVSENCGFFSIGSRVYRLAGGAPQLVFDAAGFVHGITPFGAGLAVSCAGGTLYYRLADGTASRLDVESHSSIVIREGAKETLCLLTPAGFRVVDSFEPDYRIGMPPASEPAADCAACCDHSLRLVYQDADNTVFVFRSLDLNTLYMKINDEPPVAYRSSIITGHCVVRALLFCVTLYNTATREARLIVFGIRDARLVTRREIALGAIALGICSTGGVYAARRPPRIAVVTPDAITTYAFRNGKTRVDAVIRSRNSYTTDVYFMNRRHLAVVSRDWAFKVVNTGRHRRGGGREGPSESSHATNSRSDDVNSMSSNVSGELAARPGRRPRRVKKFSRNGHCRPFVLGGKIGYVAGDATMVWRGIRIEYGEHIAGVATQNDTLFVFGRNGTISTIRSADLSAEEKAYLEESLEGLEARDLDDCLINYDCLLACRAEDTRAAILEKF